MPAGGQLLTHHSRHWVAVTCTAPGMTDGVMWFVRMEHLCDESLKEVEARKLVLPGSGHILDCVFTYEDGSEGRNVCWAKCRRCGHNVSTPLLCLL